MPKITLWLEKRQPLRTLKPDVKKRFCRRQTFWRKNVSQSENLQHEFYSLHLLCGNLSSYIIKYYSPLPVITNPNKISKEAASILNLPVLTARQVLVKLQHLVYNIVIFFKIRHARFVSFFSLFSNLCIKLNVINSLVIITNFLIQASRKIRKFQSPKWKCVRYHSEVSEGSEDSRAKATTSTCSYVQHTYW